MRCADFVCLPAQADRPVLALGPRARGVVARTLGFSSLRSEVRLRACAGLSRRIFPEPPRNSGRGFAPAIRRRSLMTAIEESTQAGSLVRETGRISSEMEDTQAGRQTPWNTMEHAETPSATHVVKGGERGPRFR